MVLVKTSDKAAVHLNAMIVMESLGIVQIYRLYCFLKWIAEDMSTTEMS